VRSEAETGTEVELTVPSGIAFRTGPARVQSIERPQ